MTSSEQNVSERATRVPEAMLDRALGAFIATMSHAGTTRVALRVVLEEGARYRAALEAIADAGIPGVSGGPNGASQQVMAFARQALRGEPCICNIDSDGTPIYPDGQGAPDCPSCGGTGDRRS